ncbi:MAG: hypothetical protein NTX00_02945 [Candidatus Parcubacteria bacterium]|nr:hypothetical protein [Candidatus Parcubacteria bacterium]
MTKKFWEFEKGGKALEIDILGKEEGGKWVYLARGENPKVKEPFEQAIKKVIANWPETIAVFRRGKKIEKDLRIEPEKPAFRDIYDQVSVNLLGEENSQDPEILKQRLLFFNTLQTPLDFYYGTDAFFLYTDDKGKKNICTIDVTKNPAKEEGYRADVIINEPPERVADPKSYQKWLRSYAEEISTKLKHGGTPLH